MMQPQDDYILAGLLNMLTGPDVTADVSLAIGGLLVSGTPISEVEYLRLLGEGFGEAFDRSGGAGAGDPLRETFRVLGEQIPAQQGGQSAFIHLKDAVVYGAGTATIASSHWRGRLADVAGWCIGRAGDRPTPRGG